MRVKKISMKKSLLLWSLKRGRGDRVQSVRQVAQGRILHRLRKK